jgi:Cu-processing system ATP-binding protein
MTDGPGTELVQLDKAVKAYGSHVAVRATDLVLRAGEAVALIGHNGAGKSTMMKLMLGLIRPTAGRVIVLGDDPAGGRGARARLQVGYLPENVAFAPTMTGAETLAFYARLKRQPAAHNMSLLERVGIAHAAHRRVGTYSKGMRQRLGLAQALLGNPRLLLLDEPTTGLDPELRRSFYAIVHALRDEGACVLLSSHALPELEEHVDRVVVMSQGTKLADASIAALRRQMDLPVRFLVTVPSGAAARLAANLGQDLQWRLLTPGSVEVACPESRKIEALRRIAAASARIDDIEVRVPGLGEIYAALAGDPALAHPAAQIRGVA